jgi:hypothetical protein
MAFGTMAYGRHNEGRQPKQVHESPRNKPGTGNVLKMTI